MKAFTIMELTIAMLIAALVISMTYAIFHIISRSLTDFTRKHDQLAEALQFDDLFRKNMDQCREVRFSDSHLDVLFDSTVIHYEFQPTQIIRSAAGKDTFRLTVQQPSLSFEHRPLNDSLAEPDHTYLVDEVTFSLLINQQSIPYHYHKTYSASVLISQEHASH